MKTNHHRKNPQRGHNYSYEYAVKRMRVGLSPSYERGHKHAAEQIREVKTHERRRERRKNNRIDLNAEI